MFADKLLVSDVIFLLICMSMHIISNELDVLPLLNLLASNYTWLYLFFQFF